MDKAQNDHSLSVILEAMVSPNPVAAEQIVEVMNCVKGFEEPGIIYESSDKQCILFSGVLGWVARKALEPTVSMEQRASLAISTAAVVSSLVHYSGDSPFSAEGDRLVEQPFWSSLCELWGYEDGAFLTSELMSNIIYITSKICFSKPIVFIRFSDRNFRTSSHFVPLLMKMGWAEMHVKLLRGARRLYPLDELTLLNAISAIDDPMSKNLDASKAPLKKAGAVEALEEAKFLFICFFYCYTDSDDSVLFDNLCLYWYYAIFE